MQAKKRGMVSREGLVHKWTVDIYVRAEGDKHSRSRTSAQYLILEGDFIEPLKGVTKFSLQLNTDAQPELGTREIPSVGAVLRVKPEIQAAGSLTPDEFQSILLLASVGRLRRFGMNFQEPRYGRALIANLSFSSGEPAGE